MYYLKARMYDPKIARFITEDSYAGDPNDPLSLNLYVYCTNEPVMYTDPDGHKPKSVEYFIYDDSNKEIVYTIQSFQHITHNFITDYINDTETKFIGVSSLKDFEKAWNAMKGAGKNNTISKVTIIFHGCSDFFQIGDKDNIWADYDSCNFSIENLVKNGKLQNKKINLLHLAICDAGHLDVKRNLAVDFMKFLSNIKKVKACDGEYNLTLGVPAPGNQNSFYADVPNKDRGPQGVVEYTRDKSGNIVYPKKKWVYPSTLYIPGISDILPRALYEWFIN